MALSAALLQAIAPNSVSDYAQDAQKKQQLEALQPLQLRQQQATTQAAEDTLSNNRRSMAVSMLNSLQNEPDPAKQQQLYATIKPMAERYDPTLKLPDAYDPGLSKALYYGQITPKDQLTQSLALEKANTITPYQREYLDIQRERNNLDKSGTGKPPTGYKYQSDGTTLEPIPGGPATTISPELSARLGLAQKFLDEAPALKQQVQTGAATGPIDYVTGTAGFGESGQVQRRIADGADALQRMLTGAGMPSDEAADYANRFRTTARDNSDTLHDKLTNLETVLNYQIQMATRGRGGPSSPPNSISGNTPIIKSPDDPAFQALKSGAKFMTPDGKMRIKK